MLEVGGQVKNGHPSQPIFPSSFVNPQTEKNLLEISQVCPLKNTVQKLGSVTSLPFEKRGAKHRRPFYKFNSPTRQMNQQNRNQKKSRFDNCSEAYAKHANVAGELIPGQSFFYWRTCLRRQSDVL